MTVQPATLARGPGRPASLYLARSKSISSSNPDLAVVPGSVDDEVSRILASKVGWGALAARWWAKDLSVDGGHRADRTDEGLTPGSRAGREAVTVWGLTRASHWADPRMWLELGAAEKSSMCRVEQAHMCLYPGHVRTWVHIFHALHTHTCTHIFQDCV